MENIRRNRTKNFLRSLIDSGHLKQNNINDITLWNKIYDQPIFCASMGINRFKQILRFIRFDDKQHIHFSGIKINLLQLAIFLNFVPLR